MPSATWTPELAGAAQGSVPAWGLCLLTVALWHIPCFPEAGPGTGKVELRNEMALDPALHGGCWATLVQEAAVDPSLLVHRQFLFSSRVTLGAHSFVNSTVSGCKLE